MRRFGLGLIPEKLAVTQGSTIAMSLLVMNFEKLLELLFVFIAALLHLLLGDDIVQSICSVPLNSLIAGA